MQEIDLPHFLVTKPYTLNCCKFIADKNGSNGCGADETLWNVSEVMVIACFMISSFLPIRYEQKLNH